MPSRREEGVTPTNDIVGISELVVGVADAITRAKLRLDEDAIALADQYNADPALSVLSSPAFAIDEVRVAIKFAVAEVEQVVSRRGRRGSGNANHMRVHVSSALLANLPSHVVSEIELRIGPKTKRPKQAENLGEVQN